MKTKLILCLLAVLSCAAVPARAPALDCLLDIYDQQAAVSEQYRAVWHDVEPTIAAYWAGRRDGFRDAADVIRHTGHPIQPGPDDQSIQP